MTSRLSTSSAALGLLGLLASGCASTIRFCVTVCHAAAMSECEHLGPIESPFTRDQLSEVSVLGVLLCADLQRSQVRVELDGAPVDEVDVTRYESSTCPDRGPAIGLSWGRELEQGRYAVIIEPSAPDLPLTIQITVDEAALPDRELVLSGAGEVLSLDTELLHKNEPCPG